MATPFDEGAEQFSDLSQGAEVHCIKASHPAALGFINIYARQLFLDDYNSP